MPRILPAFERCFVKDLEPETSLKKRAEAVGLHLVLAEENVPKPTTGIVVAIGPGELIRELCEVGDTVCFSRHAGSYQYVEGEEYRCLEYREILSVIKPDKPTISAPVSEEQPSPSPTEPLPTPDTPHRSQP